MFRRLSRAYTLAGLLAALGLAGGCAPTAAPPPAGAAVPTPAAIGAGTMASAGGAAPAAPATPDLPATPAVELKIGATALAVHAPFYLAQARGYFQEVGIQPQFEVTANVAEQLPPLTQGQLHVASCANNVACYNALNRRADVKIVADLLSAGKTSKSTGNTALVVRKDLWDSGQIDGPRDLPGRTVTLVPGPGSGYQVLATRWLRRDGVDPLSVEWSSLPFADLLAAMQNQAAEVGLQTEPLITLGLARGIHEVLVTQEGMDPTAQILYVAFWSGIDRLGPRMGERFMVAYLRAARDYLNAMEYGIDEDAVIDVLTRETVLKDAALWRQIKYGWIDPNGVVRRAALEADVEVFRELGLITTPIDLSQAFDDSYRLAAVQRLGEYRPPR